MIKDLAEHNFINGKLERSRAADLFAVVNPATGKIFAMMPQSNKTDVDLAVQAAFQAQKIWAQTPVQQRASLLRACAALLREHTEEIAQLMTTETGKAIRTESRVEASTFPDIFDFYAGLGLELKGETIPFDPHMMAFTLREPIGVVGAIVPWNVPLMLSALKIAPALMAGNTVVIKSAEQSPITTLYMVSLLNKILPPGVCNIISGDGPGTGAALVEHPLISKITFTGSVAAGRIVYQTAAQRIIPVTLELGGKSPMIVLEDVDIEQAVQGAMQSMRFTRQGQSCSAASRIFVHESQYNIFVDKLKQQLNLLKIGDPVDEATDVGTLISQEQYNRVKLFLSEAEKLSHLSIYYGSTLPIDSTLKNGFFHQPVIIEGARVSDRVVQEEIFGPVTCLFKWNNIDDVLDLANSTEYGLAATVWGKDIQKILPLVQKLNAGFVQVNQNLVVRPGLSYGGFKHSGLGKEASLEAMLEHYTRKKTVIMKVG